MYSFMVSLPPESATVRAQSAFTVSNEAALTALVADLIKALMKGLGGKRFTKADSVLETLKSGEKLSIEELQQIAIDLEEDIQESRKDFAEGMKMVEEIRRERKAIAEEKNNG